MGGVLAIELTNAYLQGRHLCHWIEFLAPIFEMALSQWNHEVEITFPSWGCRSHILRQCLLHWKYSFSVLQQIVPSQIISIFLISSVKLWNATKLQWSPMEPDGSWNFNSLDFCSFINLILCLYGSRKWYLLENQFSIIIWLWQT